MNGKEQDRMRGGAWTLRLSGRGDADAIIQATRGFRQALENGLEDAGGAAHIWRIHRGGRSTVFGLRAGGETFCVKLFTDQRLLTRLRTFMGLAKGRRAYQSGIRAVNKNIPVPEVYAYAEKRPWGPFFLLMQHCDAVQMNLLLKEMLAQGADLAGDADFAEIAASFARFTRDLHAKSICHSDFSPRNVLLHKRGAGFEVNLIDLEDISFSENAADYAENIEHFMTKLRRYVDEAALEVFDQKFREVYEEEVIKT